MALLLHDNRDGIHVPDEELLRGASAGHEAYLEELFSRHAANLKRHAASVVGSGEAADDVVQDTFAKTMLAIRDGTDIADIRAWLHTCVHNIALNHVKYQRYRVHVDLDGDLDAAPGPSTHDQVHLKESTAAVLDVLSRLPQQQRSVFVLTEVRGFNYDEAALELGMTVDSVRQRLYRARRELRRALGPKIAAAAAPLLREHWAIHPPADDRAGVRERIAQFVAQIGSKAGPQLGDRFGMLLPAAASALALTAAVIVATSVGGTDPDSGDARGVVAGAEPTQSAPAPGAGAQFALPGGEFLGVPIAILPARARVQPATTSGTPHEQAGGEYGAGVASRHAVGDLASSLALTLGDLADSLRDRVGEGQILNNLKDALADAWQRFKARLGQVATNARTALDEGNRRASHRTRAGQSSSAVRSDARITAGNRDATGRSSDFAEIGGGKSSASGSSSGSGTERREPSRTKSPKQSTSPQPSPSGPVGQPTAPQPEPSPGDSRPGDGFDRPGIISPGDGSGPGAGGDGIGGDRPGPFRR